MVVTDRRMAGDLVAVVTAAVEAGARLVLFREKDLPRQERLALARRLPGSLILATDDPDGDASLAEDIGAVGLHLSAASRPGRDDMAWGRSCHSVADIEHAKNEGAAYATLSPIFATSSKPGYGPALGVEVLRAASLPTYALGGVTPENAGRCGAVAVMGAIMGADDPGDVVRRLLAAVGETVRA